MNSLKENNESFTYTYSAEEKQVIKAIRAKYEAPKENKMQRLVKLDSRASARAQIASLSLGIFGTLIMGTGMSMLMSDFASSIGTLAIPIGIGAGILGIVIATFAYPVYRKVLKRERDRIASEIIMLSDELMK